MTPPSTFVSLPAYVARFEGLYDPNMVDTVRYLYQGATLCVVYGILNNLNGKIYVGSTSDTVSRFYEHLVSGVSSNKHLPPLLRSEARERQPSSFMGLNDLV